MSKPSRLEVLLLILIIAVAIFFRFYRLDQTPPGLYPDEAMNGTNVLVANTTADYKIFYPENTGREGLFINLQALSVKIFGIHPWALRGVSGIIGVLTVLGLYLLVRRLFDWRVAALSGFLMAISFWHVNFSRIGFRAIMLPFILVYLFYFLWKGLQTGCIRYFFWAGIFGGLGFYTYTAYRIAPIMLIMVFINYWWYLKKEYSHEQYDHARTQLLRGFALMMITIFFVALPIGFYFLQHPSQFFEQTGLSVFNQPSPIHSLTLSVVQTLGMFNFAGDLNQRHNISGMPMLAWPIGILFLIGFIKEFIHWVSRKHKHGHFSPAHTLLFTWFFVMLLPGFLSTQAPHALRTIGVIPVAIIFAGRGLWWVFSALGTWYDAYHPDHQYHQHHRVSPAAIWALSMLIAALATYEYNRYFNVWAHDPLTAESFNQNYVDIADQINALPVSTTKYVVVSAPGLVIDGVSVAARTVMFLTDTATQSTQNMYNIHYLSGDQAKKYTFSTKAKVFYIK